MAAWRAGPGRGAPRAEGSFLHRCAARIRQCCRVLRALWSHFSEDINHGWTPMHTDISDLFGYSGRAPAALWCPLVQFLGKDPYGHAEGSSVPHPCSPEASGRVYPWFKAFGGEALPSAGKMPYSCGSGSAINVKRPPFGDLSTPCCLVSITKTLSRPTVGTSLRRYCQ